MRGELRRLTGDAAVTTVGEIVAMETRHGFPAETLSVWTISALLDHRDDAVANV